MKKIFALILVLAMAFSFAACSKTAEEENVDTNDTKNEQAADKNKDDQSTESKNDTNLPEEEDESITEDIPAEKPEIEKEEASEEKPEDETEEKPEQKPEVKPEVKPEEKPEVKPEEKPEVVPEEKPVVKPEEKPDVKPQEKPEVKPQEKPEEKPETSGSVGQTLLADFKSKAPSSSSALSLAEEIVANPVIEFAGGAMPVEPGYLTGFDNVEITGFKEGAMFAPMIGSIPFVGYVFELENAADTANFIKTLEDNANLRWNICVTADEMVSGSVGNRVFFVMAPISFGA